MSYFIFFDKYINGVSNKAITISTTDIVVAIFKILIGYIGIRELMNIFRYHHNIFH